jgi:hypothetical protein
MNRKLALAALAAAALTLPSLLKADPLGQAIRDLAPVMVAPGVFVPAALARPLVAGKPVLVARPVVQYRAAEPAPVYHPWLTPREQWLRRHRLNEEREQAWRRERWQDGGRDGHGDGHRERD